MIVDCEYHHMTETESLNYIRRQFGRRISHRTYYNYKGIVYKLSNKNIRMIPKWIRGIYLGTLQRDMEQAPLGSCMI